MQIDVLQEDNHLLVLNKPAVLATMGAREGEESLVQHAKSYLKHKYHKPGNVYLGVVSRLDAWVTGAIVLARTSKAAARLTDQFRRGSVQKTYWALVEGSFNLKKGRWVDWVKKNDAARRVDVVPEESEGAKQAVLQYRSVATFEGYEQLEVKLETGRKHQIRVQCTSRKHPILGDRKYGCQLPFPIGIALHSRVLQFEHPVGGAKVQVTAPLPRYWQPFLNADTA